MELSALGCGSRRDPTPAESVRVKTPARSRVAPNDKLEPRFKEINSALRDPLRAALA